jgi:hypothetical protein
VMNLGHLAIILARIARNMKIVLNSAMRGV